MGTFIQLHKNKANGIIPNLAQLNRTPSRTKARLTWSRHPLGQQITQASVLLPDILNIRTGKSMRVSISLFLAALPLTAQFSNLATDDTGSRVWFSTPLILRGTIGESFDAKIFSADAQGNVTLVAQGPIMADGGYYYNPLTNPESSGGGSILTYVASEVCGLGNICVDFNFTQGVIVQSTGQFIQPGRFHLSRSGRYVMRDNYYYLGPSDQIELIDLASMQRQPIDVGDFQPLAGGGRQVSAAGDALAYANDYLWLFAPDGSAQFVNTTNFAEADSGLIYGLAALDDTGAHVVYQEADPPCAIDLTAPADDPFSISPSSLFSSAQPCRLQSFSADGTTVLLLSPANLDGTNPSGSMQAWTVDRASSAIHAVTHDPVGLTEATLSGDGHVVWAATLANRITRTDLATGITQEVVPVTPSFSQQDLMTMGVVNRGAAPGKLYQLLGEGLAPGTATSPTPLVTTLAGVQVLLDGSPAPLLSVSPNGILFQIPWEAQGNLALTLAPTPTSSPFAEQAVTNLGISPAAPTFLPFSSFYPNPAYSIIHKDFGGPVSPADPAQPGEIVHIYLTGLGAITPPVTDGGAAPSIPLSTALNPVTVSWSGVTPNHTYYVSQSQPLFAGLAPGLVGMNQVDVQVPQASLAIVPGTNVMLINVSVSVADASTASGYIPIQADGSSELTPAKRPARSMR